MMHFIRCRANLSGSPVRSRTPRAIFWMMIALSHWDLVFIIALNLVRSSRTFLLSFIEVARTRPRYPRRTRWMIREATCCSCLFAEIIFCLICLFRFFRSLRLLCLLCNLFALARLLILPDLLARTAFYVGVSVCVCVCVCVIACVIPTSPADYVCVYIYMYVSIYLYHWYL